ncbi:TetR/AcrR family transcriptional regulator [Neorhizobium sp. DT-125]|uniref:TetR/AcrR family transcriptional regulator n=1 Tax=Neorhizobium sp. DT-125 TaxID=3396163 RepID=UPI003F1CE000
MQKTKAERRRGAALENALLEAAWLELEQQGYANFTLEGVAQRAGTSRPVLARRWPSRAELVAAALGRYLAENPVTIPDLGSVREELALLLRKWSERATPAPVKFMVDMRNDLTLNQSNFSNLRCLIVNDSGESRIVQEILQRGVDRGEVDPTKLSPRVVSVPTDLARHEIFMTMAPISDQAIIEILDLVFLPLVLKHA